MNKSLATDLYELTMAQVYFKVFPAAHAVFDLFIRSCRRPFYAICGVDEALAALENFRFTGEDIEYLRALRLFEDDFLAYLKDFSFRGHVWAPQEPEIMFAQEPILRVEAPLIEAQIVESILLNILNLGVTLATKAARVVTAAKGRGVYDFSLRRTQGTHAALASARYSYIAGAKGTSNLAAGYAYRIPVVGTMAHSFVMCFEREIESFLAFAKQYPAKTILLVDTYNTRQGIRNAIRVAKMLRQMGCNLFGIRLDSGDMVQQAKFARELLDTEGFIDTIIFASGNLDEYRIEEFIKKRAPIDAFGVGTNMGCSSDEPFSDAIYKLVEIKTKNRRIIPTMKLSARKSTLPGKKQVYRQFDGRGIMVKDVLVREKENVPGKKLLKKLMVEGKRCYKEKTLPEKRKAFTEKIRALPASMKGTATVSSYPVQLSKSLEALAHEVRTHIAQKAAKTVLFFDIDTQYDFISKKGALYVPGAETLIKNLKKLTVCARNNKVTVLSTQDTHRKDDPEFKEFCPHCIKKTWGHRKIKETVFASHKLFTPKTTYTAAKLKALCATYPQLIIEKHILNVFSNPNTLALLDVIFPDEVYVYGVATEYCVREAVEGLLRHNYYPIIVLDAIKEISSKEKDKLFSRWRKLNIPFVTTAEAIKNCVRSRTT